MTGCEVPPCAARTQHAAVPLGSGRAGAAAIRRLDCYHPAMPPSTPETFLSIGTPLRARLASHVRPHNL
jgi:hypothetical protein